MRLFPNIVSMSPADGPELAAMLDFALSLDVPTAIRYPKATAKDLGLVAKQPIEMGRGQILRWGTDGAIVALGPLVEMAIQAAETLATQGIQVAVINPRFIKPLDRELFQRVFSQCRFVVTVEEGALAGGFGSALLEAACDQSWEVPKLRRLGIPDQYVEHGEREDLLSELGISPSKLVDTCVHLSGNLVSLG
jgi:1-deoxy-D-xylulose-5-phosphate synthase